MADEYVVMRHGGRTMDKWREVFRGPKVEAQVQYEKLYLNLRQGRVRLTDSTGDVLREEFAPRLRTRW